MEVLTPGRNNPQSLHPSKDPSLLIEPTNVVVGTPISIVNEEVTTSSSFSAGVISSTTGTIFCYGSTGTRLVFSTTPSGATTYSYRWEISSDNVNWSSITTGTYNRNSYVVGNVIQSAYYRCRVYNGAITQPNVKHKHTNSIYIKVLPAINPGTIGVDQSVVANSPFSINNISLPSGGADNNIEYTYQWQYSIDNMNFSDLVGETGESYTSSGITVNTWFRRNVYKGTCYTLGTTRVEITIIPILHGGVIGESQIILSGTIPVPLTQLNSPSGGLGVYEFQWEYSTLYTEGYDNWIIIGGATLAYYSPNALFANIYHYRRRVTSGTQSAYSNTVIINAGEPPTVRTLYPDIVDVDTYKFVSSVYPGFCPTTAYMEYGLTVDNEEAPENFVGETFTKDFTYSIDEEDNLIYSPFETGINLLVYSDDFIEVMPVNFKFFRVVAINDLGTTYGSIRGPYY